LNNFFGLVSMIVK